MESWMPRRLFGLSAVMLVVSLVLAACGTSAAPASRAPGDDRTDPPAVSVPPEEPGDADPTPGTTLSACEIVTAEEVKAILATDEDVPEGEHKETPTSLSPGRNECTYAAGENGSGGRVIVSLTPEDGANLYDAARGSYADAVDITGTSGDGAFFSKQEKRAFVWKGAVAVLLTVFPNGQWTYDMAEDFAAVILAKL
jgi:hypothetical protein